MRLFLHTIGMMCPAKNALGSCSSSCPECFSPDRLEVAKSRPQSWKRGLHESLKRNGSTLLKSAEARSCQDSSCEEAQAPHTVEDKLALNIRKARRGAAPGPSGTTSEHQFPLVESEDDMGAIAQFAGILARGDISRCSGSDQKGSYERIEKGKRWGERHCCG